MTKHEKARTAFIGNFGSDLSGTIRKTDSESCGENPVRARFLLQ
jgi:hypothetical protein